MLVFHSEWSGLEKERANQRFFERIMFFFKFTKIKYVPD